MSTALGNLVLSAIEAIELLGLDTKPSYRLDVRDATLPRSRAIRRVSRGRHRGPSPLGLEHVGSSVRTPRQLGAARCGLLGEAKP